jgi:hypothetical protein
MFFLGQLAGTISLSQIGTDISNILSGTTTTIAGLSSSWINAGTLVSTVVPGWSKYDAAAGTAANGLTPFVMRSPWSDNTSNFKNLYFSSPSANWITMNGYDTWNSTTHTGTLPHVVSPIADSWQTLKFYAGAWVMISASPNHLLISAFGNGSFAAGNTVAAFEYSRDDPWSTVANGYPSWLTIGDSNNSASVTFNNIGLSRVFYQTNGTDLTSYLGSNLALFPTPFNAQTTSTATPTYSGFCSSIFFDRYAAAQTASNAKVGESIAQILAFRSSSLCLGGSTASLQDSVRLMRNIGTSGDEYLIGGQLYCTCSVGPVGSNRMLLIKEA